MAGPTQLPASARRQQMDGQLYCPAPAHNNNSADLDTGQPSDKFKIRVLAALNDADRRQSALSVSISSGQESHAVLRELNCYIPEISSRGGGKVPRPQQMGHQPTPHLESPYGRPCCCTCVKVLRAKCILSYVVCNSLGATLVSSEFRPRPNEVTTAQRAVAGL
uniref:Uncharacterized protein n=1 Tax=Timema tahoe TaxID=61484 RepID=A0A7R9NZL3_9NEOP|nr:unnamed protein product [Timema tahoe]